jgi:hypothetical protein
VPQISLGWEHIAVKLRGVFDPKLQVGVGVVTTVIVLSVLSLTLRLAPTEQSARVDLHVLPWSFVVGLTVGAAIGRYRLRALRRILPEINGLFFVSQRGVLSKVREGENALNLQRLGFAVAILTWFAVVTYTDGKVMLNGSWCFYILGQLLTGQTLPFIRLWLEVGKAAPGAPSG